MSKAYRTAAGLLAACGLSLLAPSALAQVGGGSWTSYSPSFNVQQRGCGQVSNLTFTLTCSTASGDQRAERRYVTYTGGTHQFEGSFRVVSMGGTRISLKQTFNDSAPGPFFMLAAENGGRLYAVHGGATIGSEASVGNWVRVNTIHEIGNNHRTYINGQLRHTYGSSNASYYDKFGAYRTSSGQGPATVEWRGIRFWRR